MRTEKIRAARIENHVSCHEIAEQLGITEDAYYRRERGETKFKPEEIPAFINALNLTIEQANDLLFDGKLPIG